jgi:hypothetical protein
VAIPPSIESSRIYAKKWPTSIQETINARFEATKKFVEIYIICILFYIYLYNTSWHFLLYLYLEVVKYAKLSSHVPYNSSAAFYLPSHTVEYPILTLYLSSNSFCDFFAPMFASFIDMELLSLLPNYEMPSWFL